MQMLSQMQQVANALGQTSPSVQQLAYLLQLQQQLQQQQQPQATAAGQRTPLTPGVGVNVGGNVGGGVAGGQGYQGTGGGLMSHNSLNPSSGAGNYGVY